jgi:hypothetical protein
MIIPSCDSIAVRLAGPGGGRIEPRRSDVVAVRPVDRPLERLDIRLGVDAEGAPGRS